MKNNNTLKYRIGELEKDLGEVKGDVKTILRNHLPHMYTALENIKTDVSWLKKFFWIIATASIGGLIAAIFNILRQLRG